MKNYKIQEFQKSRIATLDVCEAGMKKHHIAALLEVDVTKAKLEIKKAKTSGNNISFTAWILKTIANTINEQKTVSSFLKNKHSLYVFESINISLLVEKKVNNEKVPLPMLIENVNTKNTSEISEEILKELNNIASDNSVVLNRKTSFTENLYYYLPGFIRRFVWSYILKHPKFAFSKMGNVAVTSVGMFGKLNGWFIPIAIHPICFGIGSIIKKAEVISNNIEIRDILKISILFDHDVIDGADMARFAVKLSKNIEYVTFLL